MKFIIYVYIVGASLSEPLLVASMAALSIYIYIYIHVYGGTYVIS